MYRLLSSSMLLLVPLFFASCGARPAPTESGDSECEACLRSGGTWQGSTCTRDCALMDISCFRDACPGPCSADDCGACDASAACEAAGCSWRIEAEAMWCSGG